MSESTSSAAVGVGTTWPVLRVREDPAAVATFSDRVGAVGGDGNVSLVVGSGHPSAARAALLDTVGLTPRDAVFMEQVHGSQVAEVGPAERGRGAARHDEAVGGVDALVTRAADVALVVQAADCVPVLLVDPGRAVAAVHAGREGVRRDVVGAALATLAPPRAEAVHAFVGPAIGGCCYEVPEALAAQIAATQPAAESRTTWGTVSLDLPAAVEASLRAAGIERLTRAGGCTRCHADRWFSHRADPGAGRQAGVICRRTRGDRSPPDVAPGTDPGASSVEWRP